MAKFRWDNEKLGSGEVVENVSIRQQPLCVMCEHLEGILEDGKGFCKAFPDGIPDSFWSARADHTAPYDGDGGVTFYPYAS